MPVIAPSISVIQVGKMLHMAGVYTYILKMYVYAYLGLMPVSPA